MPVKSATLSLIVGESGPEIADSQPRGRCPTSAAGSFRGQPRAAEPGCTPPKQKILFLELFVFFPARRPRRLFMQLVEETTFNPSVKPPQPHVKHGEHQMVV